MTARARVMRTRARDAFVASMSALVIAFLVFFAFAAPTSRLTASVGPVVPRPGVDAVVEGRVREAGGEGLEGARIEVRENGRSAGAAVSDQAGVFRIELDGGCAAYVISVTAETEGSRVVSESTRRLCPGDALPVEARVITHGHFLWVPGPR